ncbi:MAG: DNA polymerase III subunit alpha [Flavobacteriales bacterium]|jgi:DNA polymerase-3 subunit alpha|uniref:DNA polymerase III subunit alpha n=1 Tax=Blattabacterium sp. (Mastotermes darwiniensis) TaxID=39768 RepID=UPI000231DE30|nr:DNA polymerase III subunit alpha [Blattabacterium sp. (Mastotermes darwiniensis)]AER40612.1 bifunctional DNA polymerase III, alpha subunit (dnaE)/DNA polymerase III, epsilon subunit (dnaQ) fusion protein [Blattabacterium sp. (Mastotermes darwiniensis) str. MADAR]MDR1805109.1 DNA polymerase III subunit alpha [Flavobacteriales bacterium]
MYLIVDTETTGLPKSYNISITDTDNWPRIVQISWQRHDLLGKLIEFKNFIIKPDNYDIPFNSFKIHGITNEKAEKEGIPLNFVLSEFKKSFEISQCLIGHNLDFDVKVIECEFFRIKEEIIFKKKRFLDTKEASVYYCKLPGIRKKFKWPTLTELYHKLFGIDLSNLHHNAGNDVKATSRCFLELLRIGIISSNDLGIDQEIIIKFREKFHSTISSSMVSFDNHYSPKDAEKKIIEKRKINNDKLKVELKKKRYSHIHNHTSFSILCSTMDIQSMIDKAISFNMPAVGITDYGNMMGSFHFLNSIHSINKKYAPLKKSIKGIIGCEVFISKNYLQKKFTKEQPDQRYHQVFLSKNKAGYHNLSKLCSQGFIEGFYSGIPRIGKNLIEQYKENLIALTGDINAEIPQTILNQGERKAEKIFLWWKELFKEDFYIELLRHGLEEEDYVNNILLKFSEKHHVKYIVQNNTFYLDKKDASAHDILLCVKNGERKSTPIGRGRGYRFGFPNDEFFFKSTEEMKEIFSDLPEAFDFLDELVEKIEFYNLSNKTLLPKFKIPKFFENPMDKVDGGNRGENFFLRSIAYEGAKKRYKNITKEIQERIHFELKTIEKIGYPGYFLIVHNFISKARKMNISVGPGRGSVAGSLVAYCIGITDIDPLKYNLLFERFLNPDRISLPDIDIDFDDRGREKIIDWVVQKYGRNQVAQIITYATMGAKLAIRDTARVLNLSLKETDRIAKMVPNLLSLKVLLSKDYILEKRSKEEMNNIKKLRKIAENKETLEGKILHKAKILEGSIRSTGIHACGIIISPYDIKEYVPVSVSKESDLLLTQFDNNVVERAGLLKMDFLGLKTLTIIKNSFNLIKKRINTAEFSFSLKDEKTYSLFQKGETVAVFQYESPGMQKYLRKLKPDKFEDLIAMTALYRPGPLQYIPNFISRKHGKETITYDLPEMEEFLKETYGITIYQEQVMLISQKIAGFSKGEADFLRKSMGKKQKDELNKMKNKFLRKAMKKGYKKNILEKIWKDWEYFSCYAFNKSHATCYAYIAFQTAYLKTHFPCEYMASVLSNNMDNLKQITYFIKECKRMGISLIGPDINESDAGFKVMDKNCIRFGMRGIKGVGENAVKTIIHEREKNGPFFSIFNLVKRIDLRIVNKKTFDSLVLSGALDAFHVHREQYFHFEEGSKFNTIEKIIQFGSKYQKMKKNNKEDIEITQPMITKVKPWNSLYKLSKEKEVLGVYASSHPLDDYSYERKYFTNSSLNQLNQNEHKFIGKKIHICGILSKIEKRIYSGKKYGIFLLEDHHSSKEFRIYGQQYLKYEHLLFSNSLLYLCILIDQSKYKKERKIHILHIESLQNVLRKFSHKLVIRINIHHLDNFIVNDMENLFSQQIGNKKLHIILYDKENKVYLNFESKKYGVDINSNFLNKLEKIKGLDFCLN